MERDVEKVMEVYQSYAKKRIGAVLLLMSPEVEVVQSTELPWGGHYKGHEGLQQFLGKLNEHVDARVQIDRVIDAGDRVVAIGQTIGTTRTTKVQFEVPVVHVWTFVEGQITRFEAYIDNATMLAALRGG